MANAERKDERRGMITGGLILVGLGFIFLLGSLNLVNWDVLWPGILIVIGLALLAGGALKCRPPSTPTDKPV